VSHVAAKRFNPPREFSPSELPCEILHGSSLLGLLSSYRQTLSLI
jgi:hypothetical protein